MSRIIRDRRQKGLAYAKFTEKMTKFADSNISRKESGMMRISEKFLRLEESS